MLLERCPKESGCYLSISKVFENQGELVKCSEISFLDIFPQMSFVFVNVSSLQTPMRDPVDPLPAKFYLI